VSVSEFGNEFRAIPTTRAANMVHRSRNHRAPSAKQRTRRQTMANNGLPRLRLIGACNMAAAKSRLSRLSCRCRTAVAIC